MELLVLINATTKPTNQQATTTKQQATAGNTLNNHTKQLPNQNTPNHHQAQQATAGTTQ